MALLDFLYADHERVASFLAQIDENGLVKESERIGSKGRQSDRTGKVKIGPVEGSLGNEKDWKQEVRFTYDPLWINSKKLIDHYNTASGTGDKSNLHCGKLVNLSGKLIAYDLSSVTGLMNSESMDDFIASGMDDDDLSNRSSKAKIIEKKKNASVIRHFLKSIPLGIGFMLITETDHFWFSVKKEFLSLYDLDILLKYPIHISGTWNVFGVVDALPSDHVEGIQSVIDRQINGLIPSMVLHMLQLTGAMVALFGRPLQAHGLSPLIVYREVAY